MSQFVLMTARFGAYGKFPALGDFLRLGVPRAVADPLDTWLQTALSDGRRILGDGWDAAYMGAPIWRFALSAGLAGPAPVIGVLMPSVDRVGRQFPLVLLAQLPQGADAAAALSACAPDLLQAEEVALAALDLQASRETLAAGLDALGGGCDVPAAAVPGRGSWWVTGTEEVIAAPQGWPGPALSARLFGASGAVAPAAAVGP